MARYGCYLVFGILLRFILYVFEEVQIFCRGCRQIGQNQVLGHLSKMWFFGDCCRFFCLIFFLLTQINLEKGIYIETSYRNL
jgi:hypothetical protein